MTTTQRDSVYVFFAYARRDRSLRDKLEDHLSNLKYRGLITTWHDTEIRAGEEWLRQVEIYLNSARIILLLISSDFMASEYCYSIEMKRAMGRHERGEARVIPIMLRPVLFRDEPFTRLRMLPTNGKPIVSWRNRDSAFVDVALGIEGVVQEFTASTKITPSASSSMHKTTCPYCGTEVRPESKFCANCGNRLLPATPSSPQTPPAVGSSPLVLDREGWGQPFQGSNSAPSPSGAPWSADPSAMTIASNNKEPPTVMPSSTAQATREHPARFVLQAENGDVLAQYLLEKPEISIGRAPNNDILLSKDRQTSRRHATVRQEIGSYVLYDEGSANGTFVNGQQLKQRTPRVLQEGDHIGIGEHELVFYGPSSTTSHENEDLTDLPTMAVPHIPSETTYRTREDEELLEAERVRQYYEKALAAYEQALRLNFTDADAYKGKGKALYELGRYNEALQAFERAISLDPKPVTYVRKGDVLYKLGRYNDSLIAYQQALRLDSTFAVAYNNMGNTLEQIGRRLEAQQAYETAKELGYNE